MKNSLSQHVLYEFWKLKSYQLLRSETFYLEEIESFAEDCKITSFIYIYILKVTATKIIIISFIFYYSKSQNSHVLKNCQISPDITIQHILKLQQLKPTQTRNGKRNCITESLERLKKWKLKSHSVLSLKMNK